MVPPPRSTVTEALVAFSNTLRVLVTRRSVLSFSRMVTVAEELVPRTAPSVGLFRMTRKVSLVSTVVSSVMGTVMVNDTTEEVKTSEPATLVKSDPPTAPPSTVE